MSFTGRIPGCSIFNHQFWQTMVIHGIFLFGQNLESGKRGGLHPDPGLVAGPSEIWSPAFTTDWVLEIGYNLVSNWLPKVNPPHLWDVSFPKTQVAWLCFSGKWDQDHWMPDLQWLCGKIYQKGQGTKGWFLRNSVKKLLTSNEFKDNGSKIHHIFWSFRLLHNHLPPEVEYF